MSKFNDLYNRDEKVQSMVANKTGIKWAINKGVDTDELERILNAHNIKHDMK
ncbi:MAG: hypothetical protein GX800_09750 [Clostridiaceae bacterium]|nr:hypothetical protein [Clostridiaceae bacterium]